MKRNVVLIAALFAATASFAQGEMDALRFSREDLTGTARGMAMGGAFGALGGDITGVAINPAGIGVYRSSEVVTTLNFGNVTAKTDRTENKFKLNFDNAAYIAYVPSGNTDFLSFNIGFAYNRLKNFDRQYRTRGNMRPASLTDYMEYTAFNIPEAGIVMETTTDSWPFAQGQPWLPTLGYNAYLIDPPVREGDYYQTILEVGEKVNNDLYVSERGAINSYDFTFGTNVSEILSLGLSFSITDVQYKMYSFYSENFEQGGMFELNNWLETTGAGYNVKIGAILKPVDFLRLGVAYHSPTWYTMTDTYSAEISHALNDRASMPQGYRPETLNTDIHTSEYRFQNPYKWVFSAAGIIGTKAIVSVDYEIKDYRGMDFSSSEYENVDYSADNLINDRHYKAASTLKVGAEFRITPRFSLRGGYALMQSPLTDNFKKGTGDYTNYTEASIAGSISHYLLEGDASYYTVGFGYRFTPSFYMDVAAVFKQQKDDLYAFPRIDNPEYFIDSRAIPMTSNAFRGLLTFGYKF